MRKKILTAFIASCAALSSFASDDFSQMQKFYYEQGYKEGAKKYYSKGIEDYQEHVLRNILPSYKAKFEAIEASKYLLKENYITYPESYRQSKNGSYKITFTAPKVEKPISPEVLFRMPEYKKSDSSIEETVDKSNNEKENRFFSGLKVVDELDTKKSIPNSASSIKNQVSLKVSKSKENLNMIQQLNLRYLDSFTGYNVYFNNNTERAEFCYQISGDSSCQNLN